MRAKHRVAAMILAGTLAAAPGAGTPGPGVQLEDQLDLLQVDRRLIVINAASGELLETTLEIGERVILSRSQGHIGVAVTNVRLLGASAESPGFRELRYHLAEREVPPGTLYMGGRVALVPLATRLAALASSSQSWSQILLGPHESLGQILNDENLVVVVTDRRALAFPAANGDFAEVKLGPGETIERSSIEASSVALITPRRVLVFRAGAGRWTEVIRKDQR